jgi:alkaline phosphatase D
MADLSRRKFLLVSSLLLLTGCNTLTMRRGGSYKIRENPFKLGVASGSPRHDSVVLWTRLVSSEVINSAVDVHWEMAEDDGFRRIVQHGVAIAIPELAHSVHVEVNGLNPDRWYWYRFRAGDAQSEAGRTRVFPAPDVTADRLRFAYASCQRWEDGYYAAYRHMAQENLDCVVFLGDYIYEGSRIGAVRAHNLPTPLTLEDYRQRYALYKSDTDLQRMHAACPWLVTWDDHEVLNNYAGRHSITEEADFLARRTAAYQAYYEHMPLRADALLHGISGLSRPDALRIYNRFHFGRLATFHLLDSRQYRDLPLCGESKQKQGGSRSCSEQDDSRRSYLGMAQEQWLDEGLRLGAGSGVRWDIIGSQTIFNRLMNRKSDSELSSDGWSGYKDAQNRLIESVVGNKARNPIFVGGDIHQNRVANIHQNLDDPKSPIVASEFCGTSISSRAGRTQAEIEELAQKNPHWLFANPERRGYGVVEITPTQSEVTLRALHDVRQKESGIETLARFAVMDGKPEIRRLS